MFRKGLSSRLIAVAAAVFLIVACDVKAPLPSKIPFIGDEKSSASQVGAAGTAIPEKQFVCPIDKSSYVVQEDEVSGCYRSVSKRKTPTPNQKEIVVYTGLTEEQAVCGFSRFEQKHPDIRIAKWCRAPVWTLADKILSEKSAPQADVIWSLSATAMLQIEAQGMLDPYTPSGLDRVDSRMRETYTDRPSWVGLYVWMSAFCVNTEKATEKNLPIPASWLDLINPIYKDQIIMPNPDKTGAGFIAVSSLMQMFTRRDERAADLLKWADDQGLEGEKAAWAYLDALNQNVYLYTDKGTRPCGLAGEGKIPIGISYCQETVRQKNDLGKPIQPVFPKEGSGWEVETTALLRKPEINPAAKTFVDWSISDEAMEVYSSFYPVTSVATNVTLPDGYVDNPTSQLIQNRFLWASSNYDRITSEWLKRYGSKTESGGGVPSGFQ